MNPETTTEQSVDELESMHVADLRKQVRARLGSGSWIAQANRAELLTALRDGLLPSRFYVQASGAASAPVSAPASSPNPDELRRIESKIDAQYAQVGDVVRQLHKAVSDVAEESEKSVAELKAGVQSRLDNLEANTKSAIISVAEGLGKALAEIKEKGLGGEQTKLVEISIPEKPVYKAGRQHKMFPELIQVLSLGIPAYLCGPAGSGKTEGAHHAAKALNLPFYPMSVCQATTKSDLLGYYNPTGLAEDADGKKKPVLVRTPFREAYEHGGVFLLDEIDAGNPNVTLILNAALSNGGCTFPDGFVPKHENFRCVAAANTFGSGADRVYVGRNQIDGATLSRFAFIVWDYDEAFETYLSGDKDWAKRVQGIRKAVNSLKERIIVSPRASINGARMLAAGKSTQYCEDMFIFGGVSEEVKKKVLALVGGAK